MDNKLKQHWQSLHSTTLLDLFKNTPERAENYTFQAANLRFDFSKNHLTAETVSLLCDLAKQCGMPSAIEALLSGKEINNTEKRPALHSALRDPNTQTPYGKEVHAALNKMEGFVKRIHQQQWLGHTGKPIKTVVNIGIGGSDLGPRMAALALSPFHTDVIDVLFVANIDGADLTDTLKGLIPEETLFIVASKSFSTLETLQNSLSARQWMLDAGCPETDLKQHFVAISSNIKAACDFGIDQDNIFPMWDWVGGRYSLWSAIGLPIALAIGMENFRELLAGAHEMDTHFKQAPIEKNVPVIAALISHWYSHYWGGTSHAVLPYAQRLAKLPFWLQQLDMESLGKRVHFDGSEVNEQTGLVIWGTEGTNGQHSFHQLLHQGTQLIPVDFIAVKQPTSLYDEQHRHLLACCISQSQALLQGKTEEQAVEELLAQGMSETEAKWLAPHKVIPGNRPSTTIVMESVSPRSLGALLAFYENKVYATSVLLDINPFDQWGVELGKQLGKPLYTALTEGKINAEWDSSTKALIELLK